MRNKNIAKVSSEHCHTSFSSLRVFRQINANRRSTKAGKYTADIIPFLAAIIAIMERKHYGTNQNHIALGGHFLFYRRSKKTSSFKWGSAKSKGKQAKYLDNKIGGKSAARHEKDNDSLQVSFKLGMPRH